MLLQRDCALAAMGRRLRYENSTTMLQRGAGNTVRVCTSFVQLRSSLVVVVLRRNPPVVRHRRFDAVTLRSVLCDLVAVAPRPQS